MLSTPEQNQHCQQQGYVILPQIFSTQTCDHLGSHLRGIAETRPGSRRLLMYNWCRELAKKLKSHPVVSPLLGPNPVISQCTYFDKSWDQNWLVALHQDVSIAVQPNAAAARCGVVDKEGMAFVQPPVDILEQLVALRVYLDDSTPDNGPLKVVPGSHQYGRLSTPKIPQLRDQWGEVSCLVPKGGVLVMKPLILHGSMKMTLPSQRRVLHFLGGPSHLIQGLVWHEAI